MSRATQNETGHTLKTTFISGATSPIGASIAHDLARQGHNLVLHCGSQEKLADKLAASLRQEFDIRCVVFCCDLRQSEQLKSFVKQWPKTHGAQMGPLIGLVCNAAMNRNGLVLRNDSDKVRDVFELNLIAVYNCTHAILRPMVQEAFGRIVYIGSTAGIAGNAGQAAYAASKAGLGGLARSVAREYATKGITVNVVAPGWVATPMSHETLQENSNVIRDTIPMQKLGTPEDVAGAVSFLMAPETGYITGQTLMVNGGLYMN